MGSLLPCASTAPPACPWIAIGVLDEDVQPQPDLRLSAGTAACDATETTEGLPSTSDQQPAEEAGEASELQAEGSRASSSAGEGAEGPGNEDGAEVSARLEGQSKGCKVLELMLWQGAQLAGCNSSSA